MNHGAITIAPTAKTVLLRREEIGVRRPLGIAENDTSNPQNGQVLAHSDVSESLNAWDSSQTQLIQPQLYAVFLM